MHCSLLSLSLFFHFWWPFYLVCFVMKNCMNFRHSCVNVISQCTNHTKMAKICKKFRSRLLTWFNQACLHHMCELVLFRRRFQLNFCFQFVEIFCDVFHAITKFSCYSCAVNHGQWYFPCFDWDSWIEKKRNMHSCVRQEHQLEASWAERERGPLFSLWLFILWSSEMKIY